VYISICSPYFSSITYAYIMLSVPYSLGEGDDLFKRIKGKHFVVAQRGRFGTICNASYRPRIILDGEYAIKARD